MSRAAARVVVAAPARVVAPPPVMTELESRVASRKRELIVEILEHKKSVHPNASEAMRTLEDRLHSLKRILANGLPDGWAHVNDDTRAELDLWIDR